MSVTDFYTERKRENQIAADLKAFREALTDLVVTPGRMISDFLELAQSVEKDRYLHSELVNPDAVVATQAIETVSRQGLRENIRYGDVVKELRNFCIALPQGEYPVREFHQMIEQSNIPVSKTHRYRILQILIAEGYFNRIGNTQASVYIRTARS